MHNNWSIQQIHINMNVSALKTTLQCKTVHYVMILSIAILLAHHEASMSERIASMIDEGKYTGTFQWPLTDREERVTPTVNHLP